MAAGSPLLVENGQAKEPTRSRRRRKRSSKDGASNAWRWGRADARHRNRNSAILDRLDARIRGVGHGGFLLERLVPENPLRLPTW